jgi:predicted esterase
VCWAALDLEKLKKTPVLLYHGHKDEQVSCSYAEMSYNMLLRQNGLEHVQIVTEKDGEHYLGAACLKRLSRFL